MALTESDLDPLLSALAAGELSVRTADGRSVTYRSVDELLQAISAVRAEIASTSTTARRYPRYQLADFSD